MYCFSSLAEFSILRESIKEGLMKNCGKDALAVFIAINESVNNAIFHGNKEDNSKNVYLIIEKMPNGIKIVIRDEGRGFLNREIPNTSDWLEEHGRGFAIIQHCVDSYRLNKMGNEITLIKKTKVA
ncbi:MAG: putative anti-sigma regulatory factor, serine/threonine protein kinase [Firmicutes bacterium]|nr:putative anti-sigma regulatory factor, serine/threonine protein kinase [Bacillota bacterium]